MLRSTRHVLLTVTADCTLVDRVVVASQTELGPRAGCGPCKQLKPHLYRLARLFKDSEELQIAVMDADTNDKDPVRALWLVCCDGD